MDTEDVVGVARVQGHADPHPEVWRIRLRLKKGQFKSVQANLASAGLFEWCCDLSVLWEVHYESLLVSQKRLVE